MDRPTAPLNRPADLARLLLAADAGPPRQRARDQQADLLGAGLRRRVLERLAELDPEPGELDAALLRIVAEFGEPTGPTRGVCSLLAQDWAAATMDDGLFSYLLGEAARPPVGEPRRRRSRGPEPLP